jgi:hypothetical protein
MNEQLSSTQLESLRQYANAAKMRPAESPVEWREVPTSQEDFDNLPDGDKELWLEIASTF